MADNSKLKKCEVVVIKIEDETDENVASAIGKHLPKEKEIAKLRAALKELQIKNKKLQMENEKYQIEKEKFENKLEVEKLRSEKTCHTKSEKLKRTWNP